MGGKHQPPEDVPMPIYEFSCNKCGKQFELALTIREREEKKLRCPDCSSTKVQQKFGTFSAKTSRKS